MANWVRPSKKLDKVFLKDLEENGNISLAARKAGYSRSAVNKRKVSNPDFAEKVEDALELYKAKLEAEADRRGVDGVERPLHYQGKVFDTVREYSDSLLMFRLKKLDPSYRESFRNDDDKKDDEKPGLVINIHGEGNE